MKIKNGNAGINTSFNTSFNTDTSLWLHHLCWLVAPSFAKKIFNTQLLKFMHIGQLSCSTGSCEHGSCLPTGQNTTYCSCDTTHMGRYCTMTSNCSNIICDMAGDQAR